MIATKISLVVAVLFTCLQGIGTTQAMPGTSSKSEAELYSPQDFQVFQRQSRLEGKISIQGHTSKQADRIRVRISGNSLKGELNPKWTSVNLDKETGDFSGDIPVTAGGFYSVEVEISAAHKVVADLRVAHVGVGEVFVVSGQSNSTNYGEVKQKTLTGEVASFDGNTWRLANDPQPATQDHSTGGSFVPSFGDALFEKYRVPIGVVSVGYGGTSVRQWLPAGEHVQEPPMGELAITHMADGTYVSDGKLFEGMLAQINRLGIGGFRALLWHQGESDALHEPGHTISPQDYTTIMSLVIRASHARAGWSFPWFVAEATYRPDAQSYEPIREAQRNLWSGGVALEGPDTDTLTSKYRDTDGKGVHFNELGLKTHGQMWAKDVEAYLDSRLH